MMNNLTQKGESIKELQGELLKMFKKEYRELLFAGSLMIILVFGVLFSIGRIIDVSGVLYFPWEAKVMSEKNPSLPPIKFKSRAGHPAMNIKPMPKGMAIKKMES